MLVGVLTPLAISSHSLQNGSFTEVNHPFCVPRVYIHERSHTITDMLDPISLACALFFAIRYALSSPSCHFFRSHSCRYFSIAAMVVSNYGFFATSFTDQTCQKFYLLAPAFKGLSSLMYQASIDHAAVMQIMVSQIILGVRYALSTFYGRRTVYVVHHVGRSILQREKNVWEFFWWCYTPSRLR